MFHIADVRLGREIGLTGRYAEVAAFQIVNDAHDLVAGLTSRIVTLEYGGEGHLYRNAPSWKWIEQERTQFALRVNRLEGDAVKAAALSDEIGIFITEVLDPFVAACEGRRS